MANKNLETKKLTWDAMMELVDKNGFAFRETEIEDRYQIKDGRKIVGYVEVIEDEEKPKQVHIPRDRDIKIESTKIGDYGVKLIYHRMKDDTKQYRIFISYKNDEGKLIRRRFLNDEMKAAQEDLNMSLDVYNNLTVKSIKKAI